MATPLITFAIPFYSGSAYLQRAIESVLAQRDDDWRAVVIDDGKDPDTNVLVRSYGPRIEYVRNPSNIGMGNNFNRCLEIADTELVTVFHNDDELDPGYVGAMRAAMARHPDAAAVFCRARIIGPDGRPQFSVADWVKDHWVHPSPKRELVLHGEPGMRALLKANFIVAPTLCFRKRVLGDRRFPPEYKFVLDWLLTTQLLFDGDTLVGIPDVVYRYRRHGDAATTQYTRNHLRFDEEVDFYDRMLAACEQRGWAACAAIARRRRMTKLNVTYQALKNLATLKFGEARRNFGLLRSL